ncbi:hypothetical protein [Acuticoccus sp. I52.16.1]|uniref:hypothetical protein n=1 Tax=Acuticoccus sp. I52.16.1 TaxID=2928472 RepID=UPI001FD19F6A|nr:hypothetical protein [Acuticoccus sp. I52.16.1]UOM35543.1 hypothetical protein MRB58_04865 [Acuticoccus sp. I52.16.1]
MDGIDAAPFAAIASDGFSRPGTVSAPCAVVFRDQLFIGTATDLSWASGDAPAIMRLDEESATWVVAYEPPMVAAGPRSTVPERQAVAAGTSVLATLGIGGAGEAGAEVPRDVGYSAMAVFQGASDPQPALYVATMSRGGALILRSADGVTFEPVAAPGLGDPDIFSFRCLTAFDGQLFAAACGTVSDTDLDPDVAPRAEVYVSADPASGVWRPAAEVGFGDPDNASIHTLCVADRRLYAGTHNPKRGFQVWATEAAREAPFVWTCVLRDGAGRFNHSLVVTAMAEFGGALYVGGGVNGPGTDPVYNIGPAAAEVIRVWPDGTWDLVAGQPRFSPQGLKVPQSLAGPGLDDVFNAAVPAMCVHEGALYLGTRQWEAYQAIANGADAVGGAQIWRSGDGETFTLLMEDGLGNPACVGIVALLSTPLGLLAGTENHSERLALAGARVPLPAGCSVLIGG